MVSVSKMSEQTSKRVWVNRPMYVYARARVGALVRVYVRMCVRLSVCQLTYLPVCLCLDICACDLKCYIFITNIIVTPIFVDIIVTLPQQLS